MNKTIEIKRVHIKNLIISFILGFSILYGVEHFGKFSYIAENPIEYDGYGRPKMVTYTSGDTKVSEIIFKTYFGNQVKTEGNGFDVGDFNYYESDFDNYEVKSYYYTQAIFTDYKYGLSITLGLFLIILFFSTFKIKLS